MVMVRKRGGGNEVTNAKILDIKVVLLKLVYNINNLREKISSLLEILSFLVVSLLSCLLSKFLTISF
jgi:hypothetical protein